MTLMHPALMQSSGWTYSLRFRELDAAQKWGCPTPGAFDAMDQDERLDILAWYEGRWRIDAVNSHEAQTKAHRKATRKGKK
jgi:hypothetical protein